MAKKIKDEVINQASSEFTPSYAAFTAFLKLCNDCVYRILAVKTSKARVFNWGLSGGKENVEDCGNYFKTSRREHLEETAMDNPDLSTPFFQIVRKNNLDRESVVIKDFINYFLFSFQKIEPKLRPHLSAKDSVMGYGWFTFSEFEQLMLKQNHRIAFVELCYFLDDYAKERGELNLLESLRTCIYKLFERPSEVGGVLMYKYKDGTTEWSQKGLLYLLKDPKLLEGFKIFDNPKEK